MAATMTEPAKRTFRPGLLYHGLIMVRFTKRAYADFTINARNEVDGV